jgi:hypothetical protein
VLEVRYQLPGPRQPLGEATYQPPRLTGAAYAGAVRWLITEPADSAPLLLGGRARPEIGWRWRGGVFAPTAATRDEFDRWFRSGEPDAGANGPADGERIAARQTSPEPVRVARVPWVALVIVCSVAAFLVVIVLTWLPTAAVGVAVALLGGAFGVGVVLYPQPAAQVVAAAQPGLVVALVAVVVQAVFRWYVRRRVRHLPGFTRTHPEPPTTGTASAPQPAAGSGTPASPPSVRSRPGSTGTPIGSPVAPSGS